MAHVIIIGMTESGKTSIAKVLCHQYNAAGKNTMVLDTMNDPQWKADYQTRNKDEFLQTVKANTSCALFIDESGKEIGRYAGEMEWLGTQSRHWGHKSHFICQRYVQLSQTVRDQCSRAFIFRVSKKDADMLAEEYGQDELKNASKLGKLEFIMTGRFIESQYGRVEFIGGQPQIKDIEKGTI